MNLSEGYSVTTKKLEYLRLEESNKAKFRNQEIVVPFQDYPNVKVWLGKVF